MTIAGRKVDVKYSKKYNMSFIWPIKERWNFGKYWNIWEKKLKKLYGDRIDGGGRYSVEIVGKL